MTVVATKAPTIPCLFPCACRWRYFGNTCLHPKAEGRGCPAPNKVKR
jgi:hypothetical protein